MPENMSEFEKYLIRRIDSLEDKVTSVNNKIIYIYAFSGGVGFTFSLVGFLVGKSIT